MPAEDAKVIDIPLAGMWVTGNLAVSPEGTSPMVKNIVTRPGGEFYVREPYNHAGPEPSGGAPTYHPYGFIDDWPRYSALGAIYFEVNLVSQTTGNIWVYAKNITTGAHSWKKLEIEAGDLILVKDSAEYMGLMCFSAYRAAPGIPSSIDAIKLTGSTLDVPERKKNALLGGTEIYGRCLSVFGRRLVMANILRQVTNLVGKVYGAEAMYGATASWVETAVTYLKLGNDYYITPTATTGANSYELPNIAQFTKEQNDYFLTADLMNTDPTNEMPMTVEAFISGPLIERGDYYDLGATVVATASDSKKYVYVCVVAGNSHATVVPTYSATVGADTVDGAATFRNMGTTTISSFEILLAPLASGSGTWEQIASAINYIPFGDQAVDFGLRYKFGTTTTTTWTQTGVKIGHKDGKAENDPTKDNKGIQLLAGTVPGAFVKSDTGYIGIEPDQGDAFWWTEPDSMQVYPLNFSRISQIPGEITAVCSPIAGRMIIYKKNMGVVFQLGSDPNLPFVEERTLVEYGCANQRAWDVFDDTVYTVGTYEVYAFDGSGIPLPLCGDGMRDAVFARGNNYVEPEYQRLGIDREKREVHVYTQKNLVFVYNLDTKRWSIRTITVNGTDAMIVGDLSWANDHFVTVSSPSGITTRGDESQQTLDGNQSGGSNQVRIEYWIPQLCGAGEVTALIEKLHLHYRSNSEAPFVAEISRDGGVTWEQRAAGSTPAVSGQRSEFIQIPIWVAGQQVWVRISRTGFAGRGSFRMVGLKAYIQYMGETVPAFNANP